MDELSIVIIHLSLLRWNILHFTFCDDGDDSSDALSSIRCIKFHKFKFFYFSILCCDIWYYNGSIWIELIHENIQHSQQLALSILIGNVKSKTSLSVWFGHITSQHVTIELSNIEQIDKDKGTPKTFGHEFQSIWIWFCCYTIENRKLELPINLLTCFAQVEFSKWIPTFEVFCKPELNRSAWVHVYDMEDGFFKHAAEKFAFAAPKIEWNASW